MTGIFLPLYNYSFDSSFYHKHYRLILDLCILDILNLYSAGALLLYVPGGIGDNGHNHSNSSLWRRLAARI